MSTERKRGPKVLVRGTGLLWGFVLAVPLTAALIVFIAQNTQHVTVRWTVWRVDSSLAVVVLVTILAAVMLAELVGLVWRHRRRRLLARHESLRAAAVEDTSDAGTPPELEAGGSPPLREHTEVGIESGSETGLVRLPDHSEPPRPTV